MHLGVGGLVQRLPEPVDDFLHAPEDLGQRGFGVTEYPAATAAQVFPARPERTDRPLAHRVADKALDRENEVVVKHLVQGGDGGLLCGTTASHGDVRLPAAAEIWTDQVAASFGRQATSLAPAAPIRDQAATWSSASYASHSATYSSASTRAPNVSR